MSKTPLWLVDLLFLLLLPLLLTITTSYSFSLVQYCNLLVGEDRESLWLLRSFIVYRSDSSVDRIESKSLMGYVWISCNSNGRLILLGL